MNVEAVTTERAWEALEPSWDSLVDRSGSATIFLTCEWLRPWWRNYRGSGETLSILVAREGETVIGLAPLYRSRATAYGLGSIRRLGFIGDSSGDSEYLDFIIEPGREAEVLAAFFEHLDGGRACKPARGGWDVAELRLVPKTSPNFEPLQRLAAERGYLQATEEVPCSSLALPGDWEAYLKTLQPRLRSKVRSLLQRLPEEQGASFGQCQDAAELPAQLESLFALHQRRWQAEGKQGAFVSEARRGFYREMAEGFLRRGWLRFYWLRVGGRFVAHEFSFEHLRRVYYLQQGFEADCGPLSYGIALKAHAIRQSIADGAKEYDFLGGIAEHKEKWGAAPKECVHLTLARPGLRTRWHLWLPRFAARLRDRGRDLTPAPLLRLKRSVQERLRKRRAGTQTKGDARDEV